MAVLDGYSNITSAASASRQLLSAYGGSFYTTVSSVVDSLKDQSGNSRDYNQATAGARPSVVNVGPLSRPALRFDGSDDFLASVAMSNLIANNAGYVVVVAIVRDITTNSAVTLYTNDAIWADAGQFRGIHLRTDLPSLRAYSWDGNIDQTVHTIALDQVLIVEWRHDSGNLMSRINGGTWESVASGNTTNLTGALRLGRSGGTSAFTECDIFEIVTFNVVPSEGQRDALVADMMAHYIEAPSEPASEPPSEEPSSEPPSEEPSSEPPSEPPSEEPSEPPSEPAGGGWEDVALLIGADVSLVDESSYEHALTVGAGTSRDTGAPLVGAGSLLFVASTPSEPLIVPHHSVFNFGSADFTIEMLVRFATVGTATRRLIEKGRPANGFNGWALNLLSGTSLRFQYSTDGDTMTSLTASWTPSVDTNYFIVCEREGSTLRITVDGTVVLSENIGAANIFATTEALRIGGGRNGADTGNQNLFDGRMDEIRVVEGVALYGGAHSIPTLPFPRGPEEPPSEEEPSDPPIPEFPVVAAPPVICTVLVG